MWCSLNHCSDGKVNAMSLNQSYVLLAVATVVALTNFLGAYFAVRRNRAKRDQPQTGLARSLRSSQ